jgi:2-oxoglutarate dehydrogenase complex dehydrogenase (E1) component-like enzyme
MGAWQHVFGTWMGALDDFASKVGGRAIRYAGRAIASSPAVGSEEVHKTELKDLLEQAFK